MACSVDMFVALLNGLRKRYGNRMLGQEWFNDAIACLGQIETTYEMSKLAPAGADKDDEDDKDEELEG